MDSVDPVIVDWLVAVGYPFDFFTDVPVPVVYRRPLALAWRVFEDAADEPIEDWDEVLADVGRWLAGPPSDDADVAVSGLRASPGDSGPSQTTSDPIFDRENAR